MGVITTGRINGVPESGSFDTSIDHDWLAVSLIAGHHYTFSAQTVRLADNLNDVAIDLRDSSRTILNGQGVVDGGVNRTSSFTYTATSSEPNISTSAPAAATPPASSATTRSPSPTTPDTVLDTASTNATLALTGGATGTIDAMPESGSFDTSIDHDWFAVNLVAGHDYAFSAIRIIQLERRCDRPEGFQPDHSQQPGRGRRRSLRLHCHQFGHRISRHQRRCRQRRQPNRQLPDHRPRSWRRHSFGHGIDQRQPHDGGFSELRQD